MPKFCVPEPLDQRMLERAERRRRVFPLQFVVQQDAAPQGQRQRDRVVGDLGRAVIGHVADQDVALRRRRPVELVVADPHAHDRAQPRKPRQIGAGDRKSQDHQPVGLGAIGVGQLRQRRRIALDDPHIGAEDLAFEVVRLLAGFGIENGNRHQVPLLWWPIEAWLSASRATALRAALRRQDFRGEDALDQVRAADVFEMGALLVGGQPRADALRHQLHQRAVAETEPIAAPDQLVVAVAGERVFFRSVERRAVKCGSSASPSAIAAQYTVAELAVAPIRGKPALCRR